MLAVAEHGYSLRFSNPSLGAEWCAAAADACTGQIDKSLQGQVLGYYANSLRVVGRFEDAREVIERALGILPGDPLLLEFKGSLLRDLRQLDEAADCLSSASQMRKAAGDVAGYARTILTTAQVMDVAGQSREAASFCLKAIDVLNDSADPERHLLRTTVQNYANFLCNAGKAFEALKVLRAAEPLLEGGGPFFKLRVEWLYGKIASALHDNSAEPRLISVRTKLADGGLFQEAALATLDLARHYGRQKDPRASATALSVASLLHSMGIEPDAKEAELLGKIAESDAQDSNIEPLISELYASIALRPQVRQVA
jgi:tetratricopeptide (TPR) repeat protein